MATRRAAILFGCYRKGDAADPETYAAAVAAVLASFPQPVVYAVTDPLRGLPSQSQFLPTVAEVRKACDAIVEREGRAAESDYRVRRQLEERREYEELRAQPRLSLAELKAKYGDGHGGWGIDRIPEKAIGISRDELIGMVGREEWDRIPNRKRG